MKNKSIKIRLDSQVILQDFSSDFWIRFFQETYLFYRTFFMTACEIKAKVHGKYK